MKLHALGVRGLLAALCLVPAAAASASKWRNEKSGKRALEQSAAGPEDFQKAVENWRPAAGAAVGPSAAAPERYARPEFKSAYPLPSVAPAPFLSARVPVSELPPEALALRPELAPAPLLPLSPLATKAFLGFSALLIAGSLMTGGWEKVSAGGAADAAGAAAQAGASASAAETAASEAAPAQSFAEAVAGLPARLQIRAALVAPEPAAAEPFVDPLMPARTWRAITLNEQRAIEAWNASADKAAGRADLFEWLDANAVEGVDAAALKTKLERRA